MNKMNGFTLIEILFVLLILSILVFIVTPNIYNVIEKQKIKQFFQMLDSDIFYVQNQALGTRKNVRLIFDKNRYTIVDEQKEITRYLPDTLIYELTGNNRIFFNNNGTMMNPQQFQFKSNNVQYQLIFPLGKGRHYVEEY